ncbi:hypothetical protein JYU34_012195, partial [Plutella xylostella]
MSKSNCQDVVNKQDLQNVREKRMDICEKSVSKFIDKGSDDNLIGDDVYSQIRIVKNDDDVKITRDITRMMLKLRNQVGTRRKRLRRRVTHKRRKIRREAINEIKKMKRKKEKKMKRKKTRKKKRKE